MLNNLTHYKEAGQPEPKVKVGIRNSILVLYQWM